MPKRKLRRQGRHSTLVIALGGNALLRSREKPSLDAQFKELNNNRISEIERVLGNGNSVMGSARLRKLLSNLNEKGFSSVDIGKMVNKKKYTIHRWYKRYDIKPIQKSGLKKALLMPDFNKNNEVTYGSYKKIGKEIYKVFYFQPDTTFAYVLGLILGDGHVDDRKIYITGGKPYKFLDSILPVIEDLGKGLGNRKVEVIYFSKDDKRRSRNDPSVTYWRIYIYWSALSNLLKNSQIFREVLTNMWKDPNLFDAFTAGFFDTDGYFVTKYNKPETIGLEQAKGKWWFELFCDKLKEIYTVRINERTRNYKIKNRGKVYTGSMTSEILRIKMTSWNDFIKNIMIYSKKPVYLERAEWFKNHALKVKNRRH